MLIKEKYTVTGAYGTRLDRTNEEREIFYELGELVCLGRNDEEVCFFAYWGPARKARWCRTK